VPHEATYLLSHPGDGADPPGADSAGLREKAPYGPAQVNFPEDEGAHPRFGMEWWYLNATVSDSEGHQYTAMLAYFNKKSPRPP